MLARSVSYTTSYAVANVSFLEWFVAICLGSIYLVEWDVVLTALSQADIDSFSINMLFIIYYRTRWICTGISLAALSSPAIMLNQMPKNV